MRTVKCKITPEKITSLKENEIFVFGSNQSGIHGAGAARTAMKWGAEYGKGSGLQGQTYAFPTKDYSITTLGEQGLWQSTIDLEECIEENPDKHFLITKLGCGLAGLSIQFMSQFLTFRILHMPNVSLPWEFIREGGYVAEDEIEHWAITANKEKWGHLFYNGNLMDKRPYPTMFWKDIDKWKEGFIAATNGDIWK